MEESTQSKQKLGDLLVAAGAIEQSQLLSALGEQSKWGHRIGMTLVRMGFIDERTLVRTLASQLSIPVVKLQGKRINAEVLDLVPLDLAEKLRCIPLLINGESDARALYLGMEDPVDLEAMDTIGFHVGMKVQAVIVEPSELEECIHRHYHWDATGGDSLGSSLRDLEIGADDAGSLISDSSLSDSAFDSAPALDSQPLAPNLSEPLDPAADEDGFQFDSDFDMDPDSELTPEPDNEEPLEFEASPALGSAPGHPPIASSAGASSEAMLRAIAQLLVEKGVFSRDELVERLHIVAGSDDGS